MGMSPADLGRIEVNDFAAELAAREREKEAARSRWARIRHHERQRDTFVALAEEHDKRAEQLLKEAYA